MNSGVHIFALLAAVLHVFIFLMESLWFMRPNVYSRFGAKSLAEAETNRLFAFNQGFYNLFLAVAIFGGLGLAHFDGNLVVAHTLILSSGATMLGAAVVLFLSAGKKMLRAACIQGVFPMLAWISWLTF